MSEARHTPGPWEAVQGGTVRADDGMRVADADGVDIAEMEANARLIAAAPEMLEVLKAIRDECMGFVPKCAEQVDAAIAKAEGK